MSPTITDGTLPAALVERLSGVRSVGVVTGAGVSAESGIATYRGKGGIYDDPEEGDRTIEALTGHTLQRDPDRTWRVVAALARKSQGATPNAAHLAIAALENTVDRFVLLTQNVDGLHQLAGSRNVIDIHGTIFDTSCMSCQASGHLDSLATLDAAPRCKACGGVLRPDVVLFGEILPEPKLRRLYRELADDPPDALLVVGTTALFPYIALPAHQARAFGKLTIEVNPEATPLSGVADYCIRAPAGRVLPMLVDAMRKKRSEAG